MSRRPEHRRRKRAERNGDLAPADLSARKIGRWTPKDHPDQTAEPLWSSATTGLRMLDIVERSGVGARCEERFTRRRGRKRLLSYKALLVAILVATYSRGRTCTRAEVCAAIAGFSPEVARNLGVLDADGMWHVPNYKVVNRMMKRLERSLRWAWTHEDMLHGVGVVLGVPDHSQRSPQDSQECGDDCH